jgi:hypothetical protein
MTRKLIKITWSLKEDRDLMELAAASKSLEQIADRMSRSPKTVRRRALRLSISLRSETSTSSRRKSASPTERLKTERQYFSLGSGLNAKGK